MRFETLREAIFLAYDQLRSNKTRATLTILGIVVGVATVMAMSALITGIRASIMESVEAAGPNNFVVSRFDFNDVQVSDGSDRPAWMDKRGVTPAEARLIASLDLVDEAIISGNVNLAISAGKEMVENVQITVVGPGWRSYTQGEMIAGRDFILPELTTSAPVIILSKALAETLFGPLDPIGRTVRAGSAQFTVIGVFELSGNIFADLIKHLAITPYTSGIKYLGADDEWFELLVVTADGASPDEAMDQTIAALRVARGLRPAEPNNFVVMRSQAMMETFDKLTGVFFAVMIALSSIGLMVGGIGVIAIMTISVTERTREIGVRMAIGATRREILWQFLIEAATVTLIGGAVGMICGGGLALTVQSLTPIPASVPLWAVAAALLMAIVSGVLFGLFPALRASRLDPIEALRYE